MTIATTNMSLLKAQDGDNSKTYLETSLGGSLDTLDAHDHSSISKGKPINTIPSGGLSIVGSVGITPVSTQITGLSVNGGAVGNGSILTGIISDVVSNQSATELYGVEGRASTGAFAISIPTVASLHARTPVRGLGSTITNAYGVLVDAVTAATNNNYGVYINAPTGGVSINEALHVQGNVTFAAGTVVANLPSITIQPAAANINAGAGIWTDIPGSLTNIPSGTYLVMVTTGSTTGANADSPEIALSTTASNSGGSGIIIASYQTTIPGGAFGTATGIGIVALNGFYKIQVFSATTTSTAATRAVLLRIA